MNIGRESLEIEHDLIWVNATVLRADGSPWTTRVVLDIATGNTSLDESFANFIGFDKSKSLGKAEWDSPFGPVFGYTVRLPYFSVMGRVFTDYLVGVGAMSKRLNVPGLLGLDFFANTDLRLAFRERRIYLKW